MSNGYSWTDIEDAKAQALKRGEFQGYAMQALKDLDARLTRIEQANDQRSLISMAIAGIIGGISGFFWGNLGK